MDRIAEAMQMEYDVGKETREREKNNNRYDALRVCVDRILCHTKGSSQLNLRFHRLFCILPFSLSLPFIASLFWDNLRVFEQWKEFALCGSLDWNKKNASWTFNGFNWDERVIKNIRIQKLQKSWNSIRIKRIAFIVLVRKKHTHSGTRSTMYNCCATAKGNKWISLLVYAFFKNSVRLLFAIFFIHCHT